MADNKIVARARALVGARFRPQGRSRETGLDCVGVAAEAAGVPAERVRRDYRLRGARLTEIEHELCDLGCRPVPGDEPEAGDVVVCEAGPEQFHLLLWTGGGFVHADAGLGRVVERRGAPPWPVHGIWRPAGGEG